MKALLFAGLAVGLAGFSLQAQEQPIALAATTAPGGQTAPDPSVQQLLQMVTDMQRQAKPDADASSPGGQTTQTSLIQQLVRLATLEITQLQQKLNEDDTSAPGVSKDAAPAPADVPGSAAAPTLSDAAFSALAHAWDTSLTTGGLHTGGLQTGGLQTGHLTTGHLTTVRTAPCRPALSSSRPAASPLHPGTPPRSLRLPRPLHPVRPRW